LGADEPTGEIVLGRATIGARMEQRARYTSHTMTDANGHHQFVVTGASTAGKSTFSHELVKKYYVQHICIDPIVDAFQTVFPELGITHNAPDLQSHFAVCRKFKPFVSKMLDELKADDFVLEGFRLPLDDMREKYPHLQYFVFAFPTATVEERLAACRKHDVDSWTNLMSDDELRASMTFLIEESKRLEEMCARLDIPFFDTGKEYWPQIERALTLT
jgi:hypothetical protein